MRCSSPGWAVADPGVVDLDRRCRRRSAPRRDRGPLLGRALRLAVGDARGWRDAICRRCWTCGAVAPRVRHDAARRRSRSPIRSLVKLADQRLDEVRRRVQNEALGHRGHKHDPLYRSRRLLTRGRRRLDEEGRSKLWACSTPATPEARSAPPGTPRRPCGRSQHRGPRPGRRVRRPVGHDLQDRDCPPEIRQLGRTIIRWADQMPPGTTPG